MDEKNTQTNPESMPDQMMQPNDSNSVPVDTMQHTQSTNNMMMQSDVQPAVAPETQQVEGAMQKETPVANTSTESPKPHKSNKNIIILLVLLLIALILGAVSVWLLTRPMEESDTDDTVEPTIEVTETPDIEPTVEPTSTVVLNEYVDNTFGTRFNYPDEFTIDNDNNSDSTCLKTLVLDQAGNEDPIEKTVLCFKTEKIDYASAGWGIADLTGDLEFLQSITFAGNEYPGISYYYGDGFAGAGDFSNIIEYNAGGVIVEIYNDLSTQSTFCSSQENGPYDQAFCEENGYCVFQDSCDDFEGELVIERKLTLEQLHKISEIISSVESL